MVDMFGQKKETLPPEPEEKQMFTRMKGYLKRHKRICMGLGFLTLAPLILIISGCFLSDLHLDSWDPNSYWHPVRVAVPIDLSRAGNPEETKLLFALRINRDFFYISVRHKNRFSLPTSLENLFNLGQLFQSG